MVKTVGLEGNQAVQSANVLIRKTTGSDCLKLLGATQLITEDQERLLTPTEIGRFYYIGSAQQVNKRIGVPGFQIERY